MKKIMLLFTILCVSALNGMENKTALDREIEKYEETANKLNLEEFTALVHTLVVEFNNIPMPLHVAVKFKTQAAKTYKTLCVALINAIQSEQGITTVKELLEDGADANCAPLLSLITSKTNMSAEMVKLLLDHGANPYIKDPIEQTPLEWVNVMLDRLLNGNNYENIIASNELKKQWNLMKDTSTKFDMDPRTEVLSELIQIKSLLEEAMKKQQS